MRIALCLSVLATSAFAAQVVVTDVTYTHSAQTTSDSQESAKYMPTNLRVTVTLVSPGSTYVDPTVVVDAGVPDAGVVIPPVVDAGVPVVDAGVVDAGIPPVMEVDAGEPVVDAGQPELEVDAGEPEFVDAGVVDSGIPEVPVNPTPEPVAEPSPEPVPTSVDGEVVLGTGCSAGGLSLGLVAALALIRRRRR